jgi:polysaccharide export outer membrane protein
MKKILIPLVALFGCYTVISVLAQSQSQQQTQPTAPVYQPGSASIDEQGVRGYRLGPGDILDVRIWGQSDLNSTVEIDEDGNISSLPFIEDPIPAKCRTEKDIQKNVTEAYAKYLVKPRVSVRTVERKSRPPATIWGAVHAPTRVPMLRRIQLHEMVTAAGGFTDKAGGTIHIIHTMPELCPEPGDVVAQKSASGSDIGQLETYKITSLRSGAGEGDPFIRAGDLVEVVEGDTVFVTGLVNQPQAFIMKDQTTLTMVIAQAGGVQRLAKTSEVHILRRKDGKMGGEDIKVNYEAIRKGQQKDIVLEPYDIVDVGELSMLSGKKLGDLLTGLPLSVIGKIPVR